MQELNAKLLARAQSVEQKHNLMAEHVAQMSECLKQKTRENETLQAELEAFRKSIKVGRPAPCVFEPRLQCSQDCFGGTVSSANVALRFLLEPPMACCQVRHHPRQI